MLSSLVGCPEISSADSVYGFSFIWCQSCCTHADVHSNTIYKLLTDSPERVLRVSEVLRYYNSV